MQGLKIKALFVIIFLLGLSTISNAQKLNPETIEYRYWIYFNDKGSYKPGDNLAPGSQGYELARAELTEKALWRRSKVLAADKIVRYEDLPVNKDYISQITGMGITLNAVSRWMNAVSVSVRQDKLDRIKKLGFVDKIEGVHFLENVKKEGWNSSVTPVYPLLPQQGDRYNYGFSYWQNEQIKVPDLHNMGVTGFNVTVGMCDDGFAWRHHEALKTRNVKGEYDWINKDDSVHYQVSPNQVPADPFDQDGHGTATMSTLGGFAPGQLIGPAFDVSFYLSKTEYGPTETPVEEDFWVAAVEWMEAQGVEVISSSLIYKPFDAPNNNYTYKDMDGKTTMIVRAAEHAALLGIVVCNSQGNEAQTEPPSIVSPPDGENVVSVGAVDSAGKIAYFSSNGPTSDGRIKPDVVAMGVDVYTAASYSFTQDTAGYSLSSGTSFSCPLTAGVCALILSVHPELTPKQVKEALHNTASRKDSPGNVYGWGLVNSYEAALYHGMIMSNKPEIESVGDNMSISIYAASKKLISPESVKMFYSLDGGEYKELLMGLVEKTDENNSGKYAVSVPFDITGNVKFYFTASDTDVNRTAPYNAPEKFFFFNPDTKKLEIY